MSEENKQYNIVLNSFFQSKKGKEIAKGGLEITGLAMYLYTTSNQVGLFNITKESIMSTFGISKRKLNGMLEYLEEIEFCFFDEDYSVMYIQDMIAYNVKPSENKNTSQARILRAQIRIIDNNSKLKSKLSEKYKDSHSSIVSKSIVINQEESEEPEKEEVFDPKTALTVYNLAVEDKGYKMARMTTKTNTALRKLIRKGLTREQLAHYCIVAEFDNIRQLIKMIEKTQALQELDSIVDKYEESTQECENNIQSEEERFEAQEMPLPVEVDPTPIKDDYKEGDIARLQEEKNEKLKAIKKELENSGTDDLDEFFT